MVRFLYLLSAALWILLAIKQYNLGNNQLFAVDLAAGLYCLVIAVDISEIDYLRKRVTLLENLLHKRIDALKEEIRNEEKNTSSASSSDSENCSSECGCAVDSETE